MILDVYRDDNNVNFYFESGGKGSSHSYPINSLEVYYHGNKVVSLTANDLDEYNRISNYNQKALFLEYYEMYHNNGCIEEETCIDF